MSITDINFDIINIIYNNLNYFDIINFSSINKYLRNIYKTNLEFIEIDETMIVVSGEPNYTFYYNKKVYHDNYDNNLLILDNNIIPKCKIVLLMDINHNNKLKYFYDKYKSNIDAIRFETESRDLKNIELFTDVSNVTISSCCVNTVTTITNNLNNIKILNMCLNKITDINFIKFIQNIKELILYNNNIQNLLVFENSTFPSIESLDLACNNIVNIEPLSKLTTLTLLNISYNNINNIEPLSILSELKDLGIDHNNINNIPLNIRLLSNLESLDISGNNIDNFDNLMLLQNLKNLHLSIGDFSILDNMRDFIENRLENFCYN
jgi:hypothetical protein